MASVTKMLRGLQVETLRVQARIVEEMARGLGAVEWPTAETRSAAAATIETARKLAAQLREQADEAEAGGPVDYVVNWNAEIVTRRQDENG